MKFIYFLLLMILVTSCAEDNIKIKASDTEKIGVRDAYIRTTKIEINGEVKEAIEEPKMEIISPKDGEVIKNSTLTVKLNTSNFKLVTPDTYVKKGEGHFHVWFDSEKKVSSDKIVIFENVVSGKHSIVAELVANNHSSLSPRVTKTITVDVEPDYVPEVEIPQQGISEFTVDADDNGFYPNKITAKIGERVKINFNFRESSIYFAGLDIKGPFPTIQYKLKSEQPIAAEFTMKEETKITSYWHASGVKKADLIVEVEK